MSLRSEILAEFEKLQTDIHYTEKAHFAGAEQLKLVHYLLGTVAAVASAAAAATVIKEHTTTTAILALVSAVSAALLTFLKPQALADHHVTRARSLGDLKFRIRQACVLDGHEDSSVTDAQLRQLVKDFTAEKQALHEDAPTIGPLAFKRAQRKIAAGHFDYGETGDRTSGADA